MWDGGYVSCYDTLHFDEDSSMVTIHMVGG